jgi:hypothetical protein
MATRRYEHSEIADVRRWVEKRLGGLPRYKGRPSYGDAPETAEHFWARVERAGLLVKAPTLYDQRAAQCAARQAVPRETKEQFAQRVEREGRRDEAERLRAELLESGLSQRAAQEELIRRLQPLDGGQTRAWETPDPWLAGRLFRRKDDQRRFLNLAKEKDEYFRVQDDEDDRDDEGAAAIRRIKWARERREERQALAAARRRAHALKGAAPA